MHLILLKKKKTKSWLWMTKEQRGLAVESLSDCEVATLIMWCQVQIILEEQQQIKYWEGTLTFQTSLGRS